MNRKKHLVVLALVAAAAGVACGTSADPPQDLTGTFTIAVTNRENGCNFQTWTVGQSSANIPMVVTQQGSNGITAIVQGPAGAYLTLILGTATFTGSVSGPTGTLTATGTRSGNQGNCAFTVNANMTITLAGNAINGSIGYAPKTNGGTDCGVLNACSSRQELSGSRPPK